MSGELEVSGVGKAYRVWGSEWLRAASWFGLPTRPSEEHWVLRETDSGTRRVFENFLVRHDCSPAALNAIMSFSSTEAIKSAVMAGAGLGIMSRLAVLDEIARGEIKVVPLCEGTIDRSFWILRNKAKFQTKTVNRFCAFFLSQMNGD